ncbi:ABC transporter permease subunit [Humibacter ginsenosidimutans]|uniref:ABC transporter permease subunit n=1 Tax=Humibacter ginsenosidimutans TaxID=2599293 RepID=UPI00349E5692
MVPRHLGHRIPSHISAPGWLGRTTDILGAKVPNNRFLLIGCAVLVLVAIVLFLAKTRYGLIIRAGVENRAMVTALGIDVRRSFTLVFAIGGAAAGGSAACWHPCTSAGYVSPTIGVSSLLIYAFT